MREDGTDRDRETAISCSGTPQWTRGYAMRRPWRG
jgi:hypothetical protein